MTTTTGDFTQEVENKESQETPDDLKNKLDEAVQELKELYEANGEELDGELKAQVEKALSGNGGDSEGTGEGDEGEGEGEAEGEAESESSSEPMSDAETLLAWFRKVIKYLDKGEGQKDVVSNATYKAAGKMLAQGIPVEAIKWAYGMSWPETVQAELGIEKYDPTTFGEAKPGQHKAVPFVEALIDAGIPVFLIGPTQAGKGYMTKNVADNRGLKMGSMPCSAGTSIAWLFGRNMPKGYVGTDFCRCYAEGGVFLLDEIDAADANMLLAINDAISNDVLSNPIVDQRIPKHENFIAVAAANTLGLGADADYTGRERLDMATLERFRMGRVLIEYDRPLQEDIFRNEAGDAYEDDDSSESESDAS